MFRIALLLAVVGMGPTRADEVERFLDEYEPHWHRITAHLWRNVKLAGTGRLCDIVGTPGKPTGTVSFSAVADDRLMIRWEATTPTDGRPRTEELAVVTPDQAVQYEIDPIGASWRQVRQIVPWAAADRYSTHNYYQMLSGGAPSGLALYESYIGRGPNAYRPAVLLSQRAGVTVRRTQHDGADVIEVRTPLTKLGAHFWVVRLRPTDWLVTSVEEQGLIRLSGGSTTLAHTRHVMDITYGPAAAGELPFPATVRSRHVEPNGSETPGFEFTFTEYRRHTPTPEELDFGKQYGVTLPDPGPRPPLPPRGEYLPDPPISREPAVVKPASLPVRPPAVADHRWHRLVRGGLLAGLIVAVGLAAVWWRR